MTVNIDIPPHLPLRRFGNSLISIRLSHGDGDDRIGIIEQWIPHGDGPPRHIHRTEDEVFHVLDGTMRIVVGDTETMARAGDIVLAPKGVPHTFRVESEGGVHCLTVCRGGDFEAMVRAASTPTEERTLPVAVPPAPEEIARLEALCRASRIEFVGPPLA